MTYFLDALSNAGETIKENLNDDKWFQAIETAVFQGIHFVLLHSRLYEDLTARALGTVTRKKLFNTKPPEFEKLALAFFSAGNKHTDKIEILRDMKFNHAVLMAPLMRFCEVYPVYVDYLKAGNPKSSKLRLELMLRNPAEDITTALVQIQEAVQKTEHIKKALLEKYNHLVLQSTNRMMHEYENVHKDDIALNCAASVLSAFNKFDYEEGTFASFVQNQINYGRKNVVLSGIGTAYSVPMEERKQIAQGNRKYSNFAQVFDTDEDKSLAMESVSEDDEHADLLISDSEVSNMNALMMRLDGEGWFRFFNGLPIDVCEHWGLWK